MLAVVLRIRAVAPGLRLILRRLAATSSALSFAAKQILSQLIGKSPLLEQPATLSVLG
jgi:hypothetical protein